MKRVSFLLFPKKSQTALLKRCSTAWDERSERARVRTGELAGTAVSRGNTASPASIVGPPLCWQVVGLGRPSARSPRKLPFEGLTDSCLAPSPADDSQESCHAQDSRKHNFSRHSRLLSPEISLHSLLHLTCSLGGKEMTNIPCLGSPVTGQN